MFRKSLINMEPQITTPCSGHTNPTVHVDPSLTLDLTLGFTNQAAQGFSCNYCRRQFYSSQALGGHQNKHKQERTRAKRDMRMRMLSERYTSLECLPLHGSSLPLRGSVFQGLGIETQASLHQGVQAMSGGARFHQTYLGIPIHMEEDKAQLFWYGSFRQIEDVGGSSTTHDPNHAEMAPPRSTDLSATLDLTLKL